jgi:hypothetical protein
LAHCSPSGCSERRELSLSHRRLTKLGEKVVQGGERNLTRCCDLDANRGATVVIVDKQPGLDTLGSARLLPNLTREVVVGSEWSAVTKRNL